ncbi:MAG: hypothetical protein Q7T33_09320 [Dehalococcoidia bacterium]|nr:hypothetical protein [Dehalococcoidia bacterium]
MGFLETRYEVSGVVGGVVSWLLFAAAFTYAAVAVPMNVRVLRLVYQRNAPARHLLVLSIAFALIPGSMGMFFYFLTGNPYMALAFDALTLALALYYGRYLVRLLPLGSANGSGP